MKLSRLNVTRLVALTFVTACSAGNMHEFGSSEAELGSSDLDTQADIEGEMELGQLEQGLASCYNRDGVNSVLAALAVSTARELKRWQPTKDFTIGYTNGQSEAVSGGVAALKLTATGKAQCSGGNCWNTQALLNLQYAPAGNGKVQFPNNNVLNPDSLRSRLLAKFGEQQTCEARPYNGPNTNCGAEDHKLAFTRYEIGGCDTNFFFNATQPNGAALKDASQLKNKLLWVNQNNPYVQFQSTGSVVSIDPTYGLNETAATTTGNCSAACIRMSSASIVNSCCSCNGVTKKYAKSAWSPTTFLCQ